MPATSASLRAELQIAVDVVHFPQVWIPAENVLELVLRHELAEAGDEERRAGRAPLRGAQGALRVVGAVRVAAVGLGPAGRGARGRGERRGRQEVGHVALRGRVSGGVPERQRALLQALLQALVPEHPPGLSLLRAHAVHVGELGVQRGVHQVVERGAWQLRRGRERYRMLPEFRPSRIERGQMLGEWVHEGLVSGRDRRAGLLWLANFGVALGKLEANRLRQVRVEPNTLKILFRGLCPCPCVERYKSDGRGCLSILCGNFQ